MSPRMKRMSCSSCRFRLMQTLAKRRFNSRHWTANLVIWGLLPMLGGVAAWQVYEKVLHAAPVTAEESGLARLLGTLPSGMEIQMPNTGGIWLDGRNSVEWVMLGEKQIGRSEEVDLCDQRTLSNEAPERMYPILVRAGWPEIVAAQGAGRKLRNPMVVPAEMGQGFPSLNVSGAAFPLGTGQPLRLEPIGTERGWRLLSDVPSIPGRASREITREAWLLWQPPVESKVGGGPRRYAHALRLQRADSQSCAAGVLRFSLYSATPARLARDAQVTAVVFPPLGGALETRLPPGTHRVPEHAAVPVEDRALFEAALSRGLIRVAADGRVVIAPVDLPQAMRAGAGPAEWSDVRLDEAGRDLLKRLYTKADGHYVREQIRRYNDFSHWAAIRLGMDEQETSIGLSGGRDLRVRVDDLAAPIAHGLPAVATRMFDAPPNGWGPWLRVATWPANGAKPARVSFSFTPKADKQSLLVLVLGRFESAQGVLNAEASDACFGPACAARDMLTRVKLNGLRAGVPITLTLRPDARFAMLARSHAEFNRVRVMDGRARWMSPSRAVSKPVNLANVVLFDRVGTVLFQDGKPTDAAREANLTALVGLSAGDDQAVAGVLGRLGAHGRHNVSARLSIDLNMQRLAQQVVACVGHAGRIWDATRGACTDAPLDSKEDAAPGAGRRAGLLILDATSGEILAAAGTPGIPERARTDELLNFDRFHPSASSLRLWNWQQDGGLDWAPGSTFKLVSALGLEMAAKNSPMLDALLEGRGVADIDALASGDGFAYSMKAACYPAPCGGAGPRVMNYRGHRPIDHVRANRFGLREALSNSLNTWFAWLAERGDATLSGLASGGQPDTHALGGMALDGQRPIFAMAHSLGFGQALPLDGGLLPADFRWREWDAMRVTPSRFDPIRDRHNVRQQAIGLRAQVTPLQMALVAATLAEGRIIMPKLLIDLDGKAAGKSNSKPLGFRLDRIRDGMAEVVQTGTAASAFSKPGLDGIREGVRGKTGTAPAPYLGMNTAWFVGSIEPGTFPGEQRQLAFAAWVSRTQLTGGAHAAPMLSGWMESRMLAAKNQGGR